MKDPYEYCGIEAASYDLIDELSDFEDYPFYRFLIEGNPGRVLDLGCGTGRILTGLADEGIEVVGVDSSIEMLEICQIKLSAKKLDARLVRGDIRQFDLGEKFDTILIPGFTFQLFLDSNEVDSCLKSCLKHLEEAGQLVIPTYLPWEMLESGIKEKVLEKHRESGQDKQGNRILAWQGWEIERCEQLLHLYNRFQKIDRFGQIKEEENRTMTIRWYLPYEMQICLQELGFENISLFGDFTFNPPEQDSESIIYVARREF